MLPSPSQSGRMLTLWWSTDKTPSLSQQQLWQCPPSSVSYSSPPIQYVPLSKDIDHQEGRSSSSSHKDWQELHAKIKKLAATIKNNLRYSSSEGKIWQNVRCMQLTWKQPTNTGRKTWTEGMWSGSKRVGDQRATRKTKDMFLISSFQSLTETTPCMSLPCTSN